MPENIPPPDFFALLGLPRQPFLDLQALKTRALELAAAAHPDQPHGSETRFLQLQQAETTLTALSTRLRHMAELEWGPSLAATAAPAAPPEDLFALTSAALRKTATATQSYKTASSPLGRAAARAALAEARTALQHALTTLHTALTALEQTCASHNTDWRTLGPATWHQLATRAAFLEKWHRQLRDALFHLNELAHANPQNNTSL